MFFKRKKDVSRKINHANALFDNGKRDQAFEEFHRLIKEHPNNSDVLFGLAILQNSIRQQDKAIETLKHILTLNNTHESTLFILPTILYEYAVQLFETGESQLAKNYLLDFINLKNDNKSDFANGHKELAIVKESFGNNSQAKDYINKAIAINETNRNSDYYKMYSEYYRKILDRLNAAI